jgi:two-component system LytT family response regulator
MNKTLRVLIADDENLARGLIREYCHSHTDLHIVGEAENGLEAVDAITELKPDLVFLDIHMPKLSGLEVLELTGLNSGVIFTTAYDRFALKAFDLHAVDYLLKPFAQSRFDAALSKARNMLGQGSPALHNFLKEPKVNLQRIVVRERQQIIIVPIDHIDFIEAEDDYINIHVAGKTHLKTQSLSELETQLDPLQFVRIHRSYLLQVKALKQIERHSKDAHAALLYNGARLPISRAGYERLKSLLSML